MSPNPQAWLPQRQRPVSKPTGFVSLNAKDLWCLQTPRRGCHNAKDLWYLYIHAKDLWCLQTHRRGCLNAKDLSLNQRAWSPSTPKTCDVCTSTPKTCDVSKPTGVVASTPKTCDVSKPTGVVPSTRKTCDVSEPTGVVALHAKDLWCLQTHRRVVNPDPEP